MSDDKKKRFIEQLAEFLVENQAGKSIALQMENKTILSENQAVYPKFAKE